MNNGYRKVGVEVDKKVGSDVQRTKVMLDYANALVMLCSFPAV